MDIEHMRKLLLALPHVAETEQWGGLVFWVGDKSVGGKMFCMLNFEATAGPAISYAAEPERFAELVEREDILPAPYFARIFWVSASRWNAFRDREWPAELAAAHALTYEKLAPKTRATLALPPAEQRRAITEARNVLAERAARLASAKSSAPKPPAKKAARPSAKP